MSGLETISNQVPITMLDVVIKNNEGTLFTQKIPAGPEGCDAKMNEI